MAGRLNPGPGCTKWGSSVVIFCELRRIYSSSITDHSATGGLLKTWNTKKARENTSECRERLHKTPTGLKLKLILRSRPENYETYVSNFMPNKHNNKKCRYSELSQNQKWPYQRFM